MPAGWESSLVVSREMQASFVELSGDANPFHTDPVAARRLPFGRVAVHGLHLALHALDDLAIHDHRVPAHVHCTFRRPVGIGDALALRCTPTSDTDIEIVIEHDVWIVARLRIRLDAPGSTATDTAAQISRPISRPTPATPVVLGASDLAQAHGLLTVEADVADVGARFPRLTRVLGDRCVAELIALTRLVGMHVPGLHSLFSSFDVEIGPSGSDATDLAYSVRHYDDRFGKVTIDVSASQISGSVTAFLRAAPIDATISGTSPNDDEFAGQRWLVVGGSRGLGATAAMLLAAGGADVRLTYRLGAVEAQRVAVEIGAQAHRLDVTDSEPDLTEVLAEQWIPTHLGWFASPPIFDGVHGVYSERLEARFASVYIDAFAGLLERLDIERLSGVLWPSSEAVDDDVPGLAEYATVKRRGEAYCTEFAGRHDHVTVSTPRLPRLRTDQTATFFPVEYDDAPTVVLEALRTFSG